MNDMYKARNIFKIGSALFLASLFGLFVIFPLSELKYYQCKFTGLERKKVTIPFDRHVNGNITQMVCFYKNEVRIASNKNITFCDFDYDQDLLYYHIISYGYGFAIMCRYRNNIVSTVYIKEIHPDLSF